MVFEIKLRFQISLTFHSLWHPVCRVGLYIRSVEERVKTADRLRVLNWKRWYVNIERLSLKSVVTVTYTTIQHILHGLLHSQPKWQYKKILGWHYRSLISSLVFFDYLFWSSSSSLLFDIWNWVFCWLVHVFCCRMLQQVFLSFAT